MRVGSIFGKKVFVSISSNEGFIHDSDDLSIIYKKVNIEKMSRRQRGRFIRNEKQKLRQLMRKIALKKAENLLENEKAFYDSLGRPAPKNPEANEERDKVSARNEGSLLRRHQRSFPLLFGFHKKRVCTSGNT